MKRLVGLSLDLLAAPLLLGAFAYWAFGNLTHELIGTALILLLSWHNIRKRRWFLALAQGRFNLHRLVGLTLTIALAGMMLVATATGLAISRSVLPVQLSSGYLIAEIHFASSYWALSLAGIHLGWHWHRVLMALHIGAGPSRHILRLAATALAVQGVISGQTLGVWPRLILKPTMSFWDFSTSTMPFFLHLAAFMGLFAVMGHYTSLLVRQRSKPAGDRRQQETRSYLSI